MEPAWPAPSATGHTQIRREPFSGPIDFTFLHDPLVGLAAALDPVLVLAVPARKLVEHRVVVIGRVAIGRAPGEPNPLPGMIEMGGDRLSLLSAFHDGTRDA